VRNEFVSIATARADYGVVILSDPLRVDDEATRTERDKQRCRRDWGETPAVLRETPSTAP
jgi:hypothetical protein